MNEYDFLEGELMELNYITQKKCGNTFIGSGKENDLSDIFQSIERALKNVRKIREEIEQITYAGSVGKVWLIHFFIEKIKNVRKNQLITGINTDSDDFKVRFNRIKSFYLYNKLDLVKDIGGINQRELDDFIDINEIYEKFDNTIFTDDFMEKFSVCIRNEKLVMKIPCNPIDTYLRSVDPFLNFEKELQSLNTQIGRLKESFNCDVEPIIRYFDLTIGNLEKKKRRYEMEQLKNKRFLDKKETMGGIFWKNSPKWTYIGKLLDLLRKHESLTIREIRLTYQIRAWNTIQKTFDIFEINGVDITLRGEDENEQ